MGGGKERNFRTVQMFTIGGRGWSGKVVQRRDCLTRLSHICKHWDYWTEIYKTIISLNLISLLNFSLHMQLLPWINHRSKVNKLLRWLRLFSAEKWQLFRETCKQSWLFLMQTMEADAFWASLRNFCVFLKNTLFCTSHHLLSWDCPVGMPKLWKWANMMHSE